MDDAVTLIGMTYTTDDYGNPVPAPTFSRILCRVESVRGAEFYDASQQNIRLDYVFVISNPIDYRGQEVVRYRDRMGVEKDYRVVRTYRRQDGAVELTCSERSVIPDPGADPNE